MTSSITLRAIEPTDAAFIHRCENDNPTAHIAPLSRYNVYQYVERYTGDPIKDDGLRLIIEAEEAAVGLVELYDYDHYNRHATIGVYVAPEYRQRGYGSAAIREMIRYASDRLGLHLLFALVDSDNERSLRLFRANQFTEITILPDFLRSYNAYRPAYLLYRHV